MNKPFVSVLMPVYNAAEFLDDAITSILKQTYTNFEFIIINDGSTDLTRQIVMSYDDSRIKYFENPSNLGLIKSLNNGIKIATGKYIARMDSDDISHIERFDTQVNFLENNNDFGVCGTFIEYFGDYKGKWSPPVNHDEIVSGLINGATICHPSVFIRRSILLEKDVFFNEHFKHAEDYYMWYELSSLTKLYNIPRILLSYRVNKNQVSNIYSSEQLNVKIRIRILSLEKIRILTKIEQDLIFTSSENRSDLIHCIELFSDLTRINHYSQVYNSTCLRKEFSMIMISKLTETSFQLYDLFLIYKAGFNSNWNLRIKLGLLKRILLNKINK